MHGLQMSEVLHRLRRRCKQQNLACYSAASPCTCCRSLTALNTVAAPPCRSPVKPDQEVCSHLTREQRKALEAATEMAQQYAANPSTAVIWEHSIDLIQQVRVPW
jgi:hypothetical protein